MNDLINRNAAIKMFLDEGMSTAAVYIERMPPAHPGIEELSCSGCKWEFETAKECEECARVMMDNYKEAKKELTFFRTSKHCS